MEMIRKMMQDRLGQLRHIIHQAERDLQAAPAGTLRICTSGHFTRCYHCHEGTDKNGQYIRASETELIRALAQKDYDTRILRAAREEVEMIERNLAKQGALVAPEEIFSRLSEGRQQLVHPVWLPYEEYAEKWQNQTYERKPIGDDVPEYYTNRGERVRSKSEILLANQMDGMDLKYHYEKPLQLINGIVIHPDFTVLQKSTRKTVYLEHFGMMDDPGYVSAGIQRLDLYADSGIVLGENLFITYETKKSPINMRRIETLFKNWFC